MDVQQPHPPISPPGQPPIVQAPPPVSPQPVQVPVAQAPIKKRSSVGLWVFGLFMVMLIIAANLYVFLPKSQIDISNPTPGRSIHVNRLFLTKPGWLVITRVSVVDGVSNIAQTIFLDPEDYRDFTLPLLETEQDLVSGDFLFATLYEDTNNTETYEPKEDKAMKNVLLQPIRKGVRVQ